MAKKRIKSEDLEWRPVGEVPKLDVEQIPQAVKVSLSMTIYEACCAFYADPENMAKYEAWKAKRDARAVLQGARA